MKLDAHQHFWRYSAAEYPWIPIGSALQRDWLPEDLAALQEPLGFDGSIAVQARQTLEETRWLLSLADQHPHIRGVVGWVDLRVAELGAELRQFAAHPKFVGVRHVVQDEPDERFMLGAEFLRGLSQLRDFGLTYDLLIFPKQLPVPAKSWRVFRSRRLFSTTSPNRPSSAASMSRGRRKFVRWRGIRTCVANSAAW